MSLSSLLTAATAHAEQLGDADLILALTLATAAGEFIRDGWNGGLGALGVTEKGVGDIVSVVDVKAEKAVLDLLAKERPQDLILSEETRQETKPEKDRRMWIIDPLDGTACFVFKMSPNLVSVLIALYDCNLGRVTHGVELFPIGDEPKAVYAVLGRGAFCNGERLSIPDMVKVPLSQAWVNLNHYSDVTFESPAFAAARRLLRTPGMACRMATTLPATSGTTMQMLIGGSRLSAVVHDNDLRSVKQGPWDTAAVQLIVEEAGGVFLNGLTGERYDTLNPTLVLIAATQKLADELMALMKSAAI
jgi:fructose-1,6-bisphosphatase/inositol monophosphatase family enzyme